MYILLGFLIGIIIYISWKRYSQAVAKEKFDIEWKELERKEQQDIQNLRIERVKKPIKCEVCSLKKKKTVNYEGLAWFHCPQCDRHGFPSIYGSFCTGCGNLEGIANGRIHI